MLRPLEASKWLDLAVLLDPQEMALLLESLGDVAFFRLGVVLEAGNGKLTPVEWLAEYKKHLQTHTIGTYAMTHDPLAVASFAELPKELFRPVAPAVIVQPCRLHYSPIDGKFRAQVMGPDTISWGVQFTYPQLCKWEGKGEKVDERFPNTALFRKLRVWIRENTLPTPFLIQGKKINAPFRIGKQALAWVNGHSRLQELGIMVQQ